MGSGRMVVLMGALFASAAVGGCASSGSSEATYVGMPAPEARMRTALVVENNNWQDMTVYLLRDGMRFRLGSVPSLARERFVLNSAMMGGTGTLQIIADPLGSNRAWVSEPFLVQPGDEVRFKLENNISLSSYMIR